MGVKFPPSSVHRKTTLILALNVILGTIIVISSHHWFSIWIGLEMKTLSILPIICYQFSPRKVESTIKYFLVQSFSAAIILNVALIQAWLYSSWSITCPLKEFTSVVLTLAISLKLGLFPCHYWFPDVIQGVGFIQGLILTTWQKIAPLVLLFYVSGRIKTNYLVIIGSLSALIGGWGGLNQTQVRKILAFSSIAHIGWICTISRYSTKIMIVMTIVYITINSRMFILSNEYKLNTLSSLNRIIYSRSIGRMCLGLVILSLGGLPPLTGFLKKFLGLKCLICNGRFIARIVLIFRRLLRLFFYLRIAFNRSLTLFPQHSLTVFTWRKGAFLNRKTTYHGIILGTVVRLRIFGLMSFPLLTSII